MKNVRNLAAIVGVVLVLTGCAYTKDRANDLVDIVNMKLMVGNGADVSARGLWFAFGAGESESYAVGFAYRGAGTFYSHRLDYQFLIPGINVEDEFTAYSGNITKYGVGDSGLLTKWDEKKSPSIDFDKYFEADSYESYLRLGATLQCIFGADVEVRPLEAIDFAFGIFTLDLRSDDTFLKAEAAGRQ